MSKIEPIIDGIRRKVQQWAATTEPLLVDAVAGSTQITVRSTRRFETGDEFLIRNSDEIVENFIIVDKIIDNTTMTIQRPLQFTWRVSQNAAIVRTFNGNFVRAVFYGEPDVIDLNQLPAICVDQVKSNSEWFTVRSTKERYDIAITIFVSADTQEDGSRVLSRLTDHIEHGLKQNLYPLANDFEQTTILSDVHIGDTYIKVPDTTPFNTYALLMLENDWYTQEFLVKCIVDSQTVQVAQPVSFDFATNKTTVIIPHRFIYNSWPADINYGKINKGTLLKAAVISFFCEEAEDQLRTSWHDTQLR